MKLSKEEAESLNEVTKLIAKFDKGDYKHLLKHLDAVMTKHEKDLAQNVKL